MSDDFNRSEKRLKLSLKKRNVCSEKVAVTTNTEDADVTAAREPPPPPRQVCARVAPKETEVARTTGDSRRESPQQPLPFATLRNLGNTCYLSSVLHALRWIGGSFNRRLHDKDLGTTKKLRKRRPRTMENSKESSEERFLISGTDENDEICLHIHRVFQEMHKVESQEDNKKNKDRTVDPSQLLAILRKVDGRYAGNEQHDAHELLSTVLHAIETACDDRKFIPTEQLVKNGKGTKKQEKKEEESSLFQGTIAFRTKCVECEDMFETEDVFWDVPFSLTTTNMQHKRDDQCLRDENKFFCDGCVRYNEASRYTHFKRLPTFLFVRVEHSVTTSTTSDFYKANETVDVPLDLPCLLESCSKPCSSVRHLYRLKSVICHTGATYSSGHYTTYVQRERNSSKEDTSSCKRKRLQTKQKKKGGEEWIKCCGVESLIDFDPKRTWLYFDDDKVSSSDSLPKFDIKYSTVVPYLLLYCHSSSF